MKEIQGLACDRRQDFCFVPLCLVVKIFFMDLVIGGVPGSRNARRLVINRRQDSFRTDRYQAHSRNV